MNNFLGGLGGMARNAAASMQQIGQMGGQIATIVDVVEVFNSGGDVMQLISKMAGRNPQAAAALNMMSGKNAEQLKQFVENMCKEQGTTPEQLAKSLGLKI